LLNNFFVSLKKNEPSNFEILQTNNKMKIFCAHIAYLISHIDFDFEKKFPDWLLEDILFSEEIKMIESIHLSKFKLSNIPSLEKFDKLFVSSMYLSFMIVYDKAREMQYQHNFQNHKIGKMLEGISIDLYKANNILQFI
jgi:hypothetical protein